jgi:hypothetical protein
MRRYVMPPMGFHLNEQEGVWINDDTGERIADSDIEDHHARLTAGLAARRARDLLDRFARRAP